LQLGDGGGGGLPRQPFLQRLVEPFDLAAGLRVIGGGVAQPDPVGGEETFEAGHPATTRAAVEHRTVVGEVAGRKPICRSRFTDRGVKGWAVEHWRSVAADGEPGMVVELVADLHLGAVRERPVGDVGLPAFVGLVSFEPVPARPWSRMRLWRDEPAIRQNPPDRRDRRRGAVPLLEVERDRGSTGVVTVAVELLAHRDDRVLHRASRLPWAGVRAP
jgi:hypothetical protein